MGAILGIIAVVMAIAPLPTYAGHDDEYVETISAELAKKLFDSGEKIVFVDLRPTGEFKKSRLPGALSIPVADLSKRFAEVPRSGRVVLYCACSPGGVDESYSYLMLRGKGYRNVVLLQDGFAAWIQRKYPTEPK